MMKATDNSRPQLKIRRVNLDTGRENVVVISRRSTALRPEVFSGFSRVELRCNSKVLLATLLLTDNGLVNPDEIGLADPAFPRSAARQPRRGARQDSGPRAEHFRDQRDHR